MCRTVAAVISIGCVLAVVGLALAQALTPQAYMPLVESPPTVTPIPATNTPTATTGPTATPTTGPTATPTLPPPEFVSCGTPPANPAAAPHYPVRITNIDKAAETVTLRNTSTSTVDLTGWKMCSITGGQEHPISGTLAPGETKVFSNSGGPIWNNSMSDPGALYNPAGSLVSYRDA